MPVDYQMERMQHDDSSPGTPRPRTAVLHAAGLRRRVTRVRRRASRAATLPRRVEHLAWLQQTSVRLALPHDLDDVLDTILDTVRNGLHYDRAAVFLIEPGSDENLQEIAVRGIDPAGRPVRGWATTPFHPRDPTLADASPDLAHLLQGHDFYYCPDRWAITPPQDRAALSGRMREQLVVALRQEEALVGYISVDNLLSGRPISADEAAPLVAFAAQAALAISRARLWAQHASQGEDLARRVAELEWLREISRQVNAAGTLHEVMDVVYDGIHGGLGYDRVGVNLFDYAAGIFEEIMGTDAAGDKEWQNRTVTLAADSPIWRFPGIAALLHGAEFYYTAAAYEECPPELRHLWGGEPTHNIMVPLRLGAQITGMISVDNFTTGRPIVPAEAGPLVALAHQVATAVERTRLQERERAEAARLAASEEHLRAVLATMACGVISVTPEGFVVDANKTAQQILGQTLDQLQARPIAEALADTVGADGAALARADRPVAVTLRTHQPQHGVVMGATLPDGQRRWLQVDAAPLLDAQGTLLHLVVSFIDITARKQAEESLTHQALHDSLTALPNRVLFMQRLEQALQAARQTATSLAVLAIDLDGFKEINDTLGHQVGDQVLQEVAGRMRGALRVSDMVARLGGDEFAVLLPTADVVTAARLARVLRQAVAQPLTLAEQTVQVGASVGSAVCPDHGHAAATLLSVADAAMYRAKRGRASRPASPPVHHSVDSTG
jgi:diguanylate cyclase (GGDEF)-like protein/PAS domain S-box-containing protein